MNRFSLVMFVLAGCLVTALQGQTPAPKPDPEFKKLQVLVGHKATIDVIPFITDYPSVFKTVNQKLTLDLVGSRQDAEHAIAQGAPRGMPHMAFGVKLTKRA